jgi:hypothetical protein
MGNLRLSAIAGNCALAAAPLALPPWPMRVKSDHFYGFPLRGRIVVRPQLTKKDAQPASDHIQATQEKKGNDG